MKSRIKQQIISSGGRPVIWAFAFIALILMLFICNIKLLLWPVKQYLGKEIDFDGLTTAVHDTYVGNFAGKYSFINTNGLYYRLTGRRILNGVMRLNNGMLTDASMPEKDIEPLANNIIDFSNFLAAEEIPFLYVQAPFKIDENNLLLPAGREALVNNSVDDLLSNLEAANINNLDLRSYISATPELVGQYFSKTDHHWNYTGAFVGFQHITDNMQKILSDIELNLTYADMEQWDSHLLKDWFLGSRGKRTGKFFAGVDDIVYYTPKFETYMSRAIPDYSLFVKGDFVVANIQSDFLDKVDYFGDNPYCLYGGGDYPLVQHRNAKAPNDLKVLMIKDSFTLPVQAYMSTLFKEVDVIDPRSFKECSIAEYAQNNQPDIVVMMINPSQLEGNSYRHFGADKIDINKVFSETVVFDSPKIEMPARKSNYNCTVLTSDLQYDATYAIRFDNIEFLQGESAGVALFLYDNITQAPIITKIFDVEYCRQNDGFEWIFNTPDAGEYDLQLLIYSGLWRATSGIGSVYTNIRLIKLD